MILKSLIATALSVLPISTSAAVASQRNIPANLIDDFYELFSDNLKNDDGSYLGIADFDLTSDEIKYVLSSSTNGVPMNIELLTTSDSDYAGVEKGYYDAFAKYVARITGWNVSHKNFSINAGSTSWVNFMGGLETGVYRTKYNVNPHCPTLTDTPTAPLDDALETGTPDPSYLGYNGSTTCLSNYITTTYGGNSTNVFVHVNADEDLRNSGLMNSYYKSNGETYHSISIYDSFDNYGLDRTASDVWIQSEKIYTLKGYGIKDQLAEKYNETHPHLTHAQALARVIEFNDVESMARSYFKQDVNRDAENVIIAAGETASQLIFDSFRERKITNVNSPYKDADSSQIIAPIETQYEFSYRTTTFGNDADASNIVSKIFRHKRTRSSIVRYQNSIRDNLERSRLEAIPAQEQNAFKWLIDNNLFNFVIPTSSKYNSIKNDAFENVRHVAQQLFQSHNIGNSSVITKTTYVNNEDYEKILFGLNRTFAITDLGINYGKNIDMINVYTAASETITLFKKTSFDIDITTTNLYNFPIVVNEASNIHLKLIELKNLHEAYSHDVIRPNVSRVEKKRWLKKHNIILVDEEEEMFEIVNTDPTVNFGISTLSSVEEHTTSGKYIHTERSSSLSTGSLSVYIPRPELLPVGELSANGFTQLDITDYTDSNKSLVDASLIAGNADNDYLYVSNLIAKIFSVSSLKDDILIIKAHSNGLERLANTNTILLWSVIISLIAVSSIVALSIKPFIQSSIKLAKRSEIARKDILTGIKNRFSLVTHDVVELQKYAETATIVFIDLDKFKEINDTRGHAVGDRVLQVVAKRLQKYADSGYVPFRIGGDEFVVLVSNKSKDDVEEYANHIMKEIKRPIVFADFVIHPEGSVGIAEGNIKEKDIDQILSEADLSLYNVKRTGKVGWHDDGHIEWVNMIKENLLDTQTKGFVTPYFQPIVYKDGSIASAEALFRSVNPEINRNLGKFFGTIDKLNWFDVVDLRMADAVFSEIRRKFWAENKSGKIAFSLNVHPYTLLKVSNYAEYIDDLAERYNLNRNHITVEVTEFAIEDQKLMNQIKEIKAKGFMIAIDDFSAGHSSLGRISLFKDLVDMIKIDQGVILNQKVSMAKSVIKFVESISQELGATVVVEGVETKEYLIGSPKTKYQGYYFSKPIPVNELEEAKKYKTADWLKKQKRIQDMISKKKKEEIASSDFKPAMPGKR